LIDSDSPPSEKNTQSPNITSTQRATRSGKKSGKSNETIYSTPDEVPQDDPSDEDEEEEAVPPPPVPKVKHVWNSIKCR